MKKLILSVVTSTLLTFSLPPLIGSAEANLPAKDLSDLKVELENAKLIPGEKLKAEKVDKKKKAFDAVLKEQGISEDELRKEGSFYYDSSSGKFVVQVKKDIKDASKKEKFNKLKTNNKDKIKNPATVATTAETKTITSDVIIEEVKYSNEELIGIQDEFFKINDPKQFTQNTILAIDNQNNRLELLTDSIGEDLKKSLENTYGDKLYIKVDPDYVDAQDFKKARKDNWNSLGAGIGLKNNRLSQCTTAGIAYKSTQYFIVTAGHCIGTGGSVAYQFGVPVGTAHLNSMSSGFDFGLVRIDRPNELTGGRLATNGYYISGGSTGYDAKLSGTAEPYAGMPVCKSGIRTGYTCGEVKHVRTIHPHTDLIGIKVYSTNTRFASYGDSGSPLTYYSGGTYRNVGILSAGLTTNEYDNTVYFTPLVEMYKKYGLYSYSSNTPRKL
ncbi:S1 family peptidase (plasmid) [Bacillus badius]|uniref:S1 family peptidase n=1 Tax=Bacillus badius TaxID=1455 RepID=UPI001CBC44AD|nr:S1 family peptidase [Bacillus badius]UAT32902.1 S1 family peptidase [Bacillus badius]